MSADGRVFDGHTSVFGVDTDTDPSALPNNTVARAVNRIFRGGRNLTRPPFVHKPFTFDLGTHIDGDASPWEDLVRNGNVQGWMPYTVKKPGREEGMVVAIAGKIFFLSLVNEKILVRLVFEGNDPSLLHTWFVQAEEWVYIQNGLDRPIFWNGQFPSSARRSDPDPAKFEMPVGTLMAYIHGRVFLSNALDQVLASDIIYGEGLTSSDSTQRFTENQYWAGGGYFGSPTELGHITGMGVIARQDQKLNGQGELVVLHENGAYSIEASAPRSTWQTQQVQTITINGRGCVAPDSVVVVNNDLWFRSDDGLASYQNLRYDEKRQLSFGKASRQVNRWYDQDTDWLIRFCNSIYFDNRIISTVSPVIAQPKAKGYGNHRFHRGMVALDLDQASGVSGDTSYNWDGLWTGIRPTALLKLGKRAFAMSYDVDGENRIYEITKNGRNDLVNETSVQTEWFYLTKRFDWMSTGRANEFEVKKLVGGEFWVSDIRERVSFGVDYRADNSLCWNTLLRDQEFGSDFGDDWKFTHPRYGRLKFQSPEEKSDCGAPYPSSHGSQHQVMVFGKGRVRVDRLRVAMAAKPDPNAPQGSCIEDDPETSLDNNCKLDDDFAYNIAASR